MSGQVPAARDQVDEPVGSAGEWRQTTTPNGETSARQLSRVADAHGWPYTHLYNLHRVIAGLFRLPASVVDAGTTLGDVDRLLLTHSVGTLLPAFRAALESRHVTVDPITVGRERDLP